MKKFLLVLMTGLVLSAQAQQVPTYHRGQPVSYSDPALSNLKFTDMSNITANMDMLYIGSAVNMQFNVRNNDALNAVPEGTCMIKITLGSKFQVADPSMIAQLPLDEYFHWTMEPASRNGQAIITGELYKELPPHFAGVVNVKLMPSVAGGSTTTCQLMISNDRNPVTVLSDLAPMNNILSQHYTNLRSSGIKFLQFSALARGCSLDINWSIFDDARLAKRFIVETSGDGTNYIPVKTILATGAGSYNFLLEGVNAKSISVRVRVETNDGGFIYSAPQLVTNLCNGAFDISLFPNPAARNITELSITARSGIFNGKYNIKLTDIAGKEIKVSEATYSNQAQVKFVTGMIPAGSYMITVTPEDGQAIGLKFVKQ